MMQEFSIEKFRGQPCSKRLALSFGSEQDAEALLALEQRVYQAMPQQEWLVPATEKELCAQLKEDGMFLCLWDGPELVAYLSILYKGDHPENYACDLGLPAAARPVWANIDTAVVALEYRGNHIQRRLLTLAESLRRPDIQGFAATVSPDNPYSFQALVQAGFCERCRKEKYGGHLRAVMAKTLAPLPGLYRHFKGGRYRVIGLASHSETLEPMVVYQALYGEQGLWVRPVSMWFEWVDKPGYQGPRFMPEPPGSDA